VQILTLHSPRWSLANSSHKAPFDVSSSKLEQLNAYYWADRAFVYLRDRIGVQVLPAQPIKIYVDDVFTGLVSSDSSIHLKKAAEGVPLALSGEVVVQLIAQELAQNLSGGRIFPVSSVQHKICGADPRGCCQTQNGCAQALANAFGDYVAAILFPGAPRLGESLSESRFGQNICGYQRDLDGLVSLTQSQIYSTCSDSGKSGNVVLMGSWFASQWWAAREQAEKAFPGEGAKAIDRIFFDLARSWTGTSLFNDAKVSALNLAAQRDSGKYLSILTQALSSIASN
jgi:hypothetical protein